MTRRLATPGTALALGIGVILLTLTAVAFTVADHRLSAGDGGSIILVPGFGIVGLIVARRQPRNPMGWILLGLALCLALDDASSTYSVLDYRRHHGSLPLGELAVLLQPAWAPGIALLVLSILLFPDGEIPPGRWRLPLGFFAAGCVVWLVAAYGIAVDAIVSNRVHVDSTGNLLLEDHPTGALGLVGRLPGRVLPRRPADRGRVGRCPDSRLPARDRRAPGAAEVAHARSGHRARRRPARPLRATRAARGS